MSTTTLIANFPKTGTPTIHAVGCRHTLRGQISEPGPHALRQGRFASCVLEGDRSTALSAAFDGWQD